VQAVIGHPLTVYGKGGQTRGFLNIKDTLQCVELAVDNPARQGEFRVFNQFTEQFNVRQLAETVHRAAGQLGISAEIQHIDDPRVEAEEHYYNARNTALMSLGLQPHYLSDELVESMIGIIQRYQARVIRERIMPRIQWRPSEPILAGR
jgi:UDP-sulfoquinovose synthase